MKVFYWSPFYSPVATIKNVINSAYSLKKYNSDYNISLIDTIGEWNEFKNDLANKKINIIKLGRYNLSRFYPIQGFFKTRILSIFIFFNFFFRLKKILHEQKPDYLILNLLTSLPIVLLFFFDFKTRFILRISGLPKLNIFRKILWKLVSKKIFLVTCPSVETQQKILNKKIFSENKTQLLYDPIIIVKDFCLNKKIKIKSNFNDFFLNIGRLTRQKNQILLLNYFKNSQIGKKLLILGDGENKKKFINFINKNNLTDKIYLLGYQKNVYSYIFNSKAIIISSLWEDPGAVMIEAAIANCSIISSDCESGPKEFINNNRGGYLFQNNSIKELSAQINFFLNEDKTLVFRKKVYAKKKARQYTLFNHYKNLNKYLSIK